MARVFRVCHAHDAAAGRARQPLVGTGTRASYALAQTANTLLDLAFLGLRATGLRGKDIEALVREWKRQGLSVGTMKNRMAHVRWWAKRSRRSGVVRSNASEGIPGLSSAMRRIDIAARGRIVRKLSHGRIS